MTIEGLISAISWHHYKLILCNNHQYTLIKTRRQAYLIGKFSAKSFIQSVHDGKTKMQSLSSISDFPIDTWFAHYLISLNFRLLSQANGRRTRIDIPRRRIVIFHFSWMTASGPWTITVHGSWIFRLGVPCTFGRCFGHSLSGACRSRPMIAVSTYRMGICYWTTSPASRSRITMNDNRCRSTISIITFSFWRMRATSWSVPVTIHFIWMLWWVATWCWSSAMAALRRTRPISFMLAWRNRPWSMFACVLSWVPWQWSTTTNTLIRPYSSSLSFYRRLRLAVSVAVYWPFGRWTTSRTRTTPTTWSVMFLFFSGTSRSSSFTMMHWRTTAWKMSFSWWGKRYGRRRSSPPSANITATPTTNESGHIL